jgi:hypothetical protein
MSETKLASRGGSVSALEQTAEEHHQAIGGFLKMAEAAITSLRYTSYLNDREVGKALGKIVRAINEARPVLDRQRTRVLGGRAGGDAYFGDEPQNPPGAYRERTQTGSIAPAGRSR